MTFDGINVYYSPGDLSPGYYTVTATSGTGKSATANLTVVGIKKLSMTAYGKTITSETNHPKKEQSICIDFGRQEIGAGSITITAEADPGGSFPDTFPKWYVGETEVQSDGTAYNFSAQNRAKGSYKITAKCGHSEKSVIVYVTSCTYIVKVNEPIPGSGIPLGEFRYTFPYVYDIGHSIAQISVSPAEALEIAPFDHKDYGNIDFGFNPVNKAAVITDGGSIGKLTLNDTIASFDSFGSYNIKVENAFIGLSRAESEYKKPSTYILAKQLSVYYAMCKFF